MSEQSDPWSRPIRRGRRPARPRCLAAGATPTRPGSAERTAARPASGFSAETTILDATWTAAPTGSCSARRRPTRPCTRRRCPGLDDRGRDPVPGHGGASAHRDVPARPARSATRPTRRCSAPRSSSWGSSTGVVPVESAAVPARGLLHRAAARAAPVDDRRRPPRARRRPRRRLARRRARLAAARRAPSRRHRRQLDIWHDVRRPGARRPRAPAARPGARVARGQPARRARAVAVLGRPAPRQHHLARRRASPASPTSRRRRSRPPQVDLGWWLMFDRTMHEAYGAPRRPATSPATSSARCTRSSSAARSATPPGTRCSPRPATRAIVVRVMNRLVDRGDLPADQTIWLENPVVPCLAALMEEDGHLTSTEPVDPPADDEFHPPTSDDPLWTETCWFTFTVPERRLSGQLYPFFRPNQGVTAAGAYFWDDRGDQMWNCRYAKNFWHLPLPDQPLTDIQLPNGIRYRCLEPQQRYAIGYDDPDGDDLHVDLTFTAAARPTCSASATSTSPAATRARSCSTARRSRSTPTGSATGRGGRGRSSATPCTARAERRLQLRHRVGARRLPRHHHGLRRRAASASTATSCATASGRSWRRRRARSSSATPTPGSPAGRARHRRRARPRAPRRGHGAQPARLPDQPEPVHHQLPDRVDLRRRHAPTARTTTTGPPRPSAASCAPADPAFGAIVGARATTQRPN